MNKIIWTIGHSTHSFEHFLAMLNSFSIEILADIRSYPGSKKFPHFNLSNLKTALPEAGIGYVHVKALGGRRKSRPDQKNAGWRHAAFKGYADYMDTADFLEGITELEALAYNKRLAYMCSEAVWWRCHRSLVSDYLKLNGWHVNHIMNIGKTVEHPYTKPAKIVNGQLTYPRLS